MLNEEQRIKNIIAKKVEIDKQNVVIAKTTEMDNLAIISRYANLVKAGRIESVRLPQIYKTKNAEERLEDGYGMLQEFQKLLQTRTESQYYPVQ